MIESRKFLEYSEYNERYIDSAQPQPNMICRRLPSPSGAPNFWADSCNRRRQDPKSHCTKSNCPGGVQI